MKYHLETAIVGSKFRPECFATLAALKPGDALRVVRDLHNSYDRKAVAIYAGEEHLGFVPQKLNGRCAELLDAGKSLRCTLTLEAIIDKDDLKFAPKVKIEEE